MRDLSLYQNDSFQTGRHILIRTLWYLVSATLFESAWLPSSKVKCQILKWFGAEIGKGVVIKPNVRLKFPWKLRIGAYSWIGQGVWIDNLDYVHIGEHVCISQLTYLCGGSHDHTSAKFDLLIKPIIIHDRVWVAARCTILHGVEIGEGAVICAGSVVHQSIEAELMVGGIPAKSIKRLTHSDVIINAAAI